MKLTHIAITNWRNFAHIEFDLSSRLFVVGPNSSGKTNLLAALRFLGDIARRGLVAASEDLGGPERYFRSGADSASVVAKFDDNQNSTEFALFLRLMSEGSESTKRASAADQTLSFLMTDPLTGGSTTGIWTFIKQSRQGARSLQTKASPSRLKMRKRSEQEFVKPSRASDTSIRIPRRCLKRSDR